MSFEKLRLRSQHFKFISIRGRIRAAVRRTSPPWQDHSTDRPSECRHRLVARQLHGGHERLRLSSDPRLGCRGLVEAIIAMLVSKASSHSVSRLGLRPDPLGKLEHTTLWDIGHLFRPCHKGRDGVPTYGFHSRANWRARWSAAAEFGEGLVRCDGGEPSARGLDLGSREGSGNSEFRIGRRATSVSISALQSANCEL